MEKIIVAGIGTDVGKTIVSAILVNALKSDYWKPIQCGSIEHSDSETIRTLIPASFPFCHPSSYILKHPLATHAAAKLEGISIDPNRIVLPSTQNTLIIECTAGLLNTLNENCLQLDHFSIWDCKWILVSRHYLGSLNHTLLSLEALKQRNVRLLGMIFNGEKNPQVEQVILQQAKAPFIGRLSPETSITPEIINHYATLWKPQLKKLLNIS